MNQVDPLRPRSKDVGSGLDLVIGFRRLFGLRRLGLDVRMGWFYPGQAFLRNQGDEEAPVIRRADQAMSVIAKFWWGTSGDARAEASHDQANSAKCRSL